MSLAVDGDVRTGWVRRSVLVGVLVLFAGAGIVFAYLQNRERERRLNRIAPLRVRSLPPPTERIDPVDRPLEGILPPRSRLPEPPAPSFPIREEWGPRVDGWEIRARPPTLQRDDPTSTAP